MGFLTTRLICFCGHFSIDAAICDLVHDVERVFLLCYLKNAFRNHI